VHPLAVCESDDIGPGTRIGPFSHIHSGARLGAGCTVEDGVMIESGAVIGDRVSLGVAAIVTSRTRLDDDVTVGARVTFTHEAGIPGHAHDVDPAETMVRAGASVGAGATVLGGIEIGRGAVVAAGTVVTRSVPPHAFVSGNPGQIVRYVDAESDEGSVATDAPGPSVTAIHVTGVYVHRFPEFSDFRGSLTSGEMPVPGLPFVPRRWFLVYDVPSRELRGEHAHRVCHQFLMCVAGSVTVSVDDGEHRGEVVLDRPNIGIYVPPMVWGSQFRYEPDTVLMVLASHPYDASDYIRAYEVYMRELAHVSPAVEPRRG
jgi:acetyltransferase-like isoleucine patch superfamily enzyme/dTDP-4-dehydrorhamnose 3,5-epimerase-like enzyme